MEINKDLILPGSGLAYHQFTTPVAEILQTFKNPTKNMCSEITFSTDEMTALCPLTGQPDYYDIKISYRPKEKCIESKSSKFYIGAFRSFPGFIETIAEKIHKDWSLISEAEYVVVDITMKPRGGIAIRVIR